MKILGISAFYHDSAAAIIVDGKIICASQEERYTRKKHDASFPKNAIQFCLKESGLSIDDLDAVAFYDKPFLKFERLLETYTSFAPKGLHSFITAMPVWLKEKMFLKKLIKDQLFEVEEYDKKKIKLLFPEHHLSHGASAFYPSNYQESAILTIDGVGEWATTTIAYGKENAIEIKKEIHFPHSVGLLYSAFTYFLGFKVNAGEYKLMGLAPYGNSLESEQYIKKIKEHLVQIFDDGSIWLDQSYFSYATSLKMVDNAKWEKLFSIKKRESEDEITQQHCNLAFAIQQITEEIVIKLAKHAKEITQSKNLCLAGGVALNCVANGKLQKENIFKNIYIQPASGDSGGALGAALAANHIYFEQERVVSENYDLMNGAYLGDEFTWKDIELMAKKYQANYKVLDNEDLNTFIAKKIAEGKVIGWMQGKMEFGPRALGNRSILADARNEESQQKVNLKIKYRESFRPFAPSVLEEDAAHFFELENKSPYMLLVQNVDKSVLLSLPENYDNLSLSEKLNVKRSTIPAVTHVDNSARIQTVSKTTNPKYHALIIEFKKQTGVGLLVNTSFNVRGEPLVRTPEDAYKCFMRTEIDFLVIENAVFDKKNQPIYEKDYWQEEFTLD